MTNSGILIYAQTTRESYIHKVFFELVSKSHELSEKLNGAEINAVIFVENEAQLEGYKESFRNIGLNKVYFYADEKFKNYSTEIYSKAIVKLIREIKPEIFLVGATTQGRDLAPRISSSLGTGLTADCTSLDINDKGQLAATRPTFGGELMATILCKTYPQMATARENVFKIDIENRYKDTEFFKMDLSEQDLVSNVEIVKFDKFQDIDLNELDSAEIIVAGGKGLKNAKGFELLKRFADKIGGSLAASRGAVELGLAPSSIQVGQTGKTVHPKVYIACAISGAIQHTVGMTGSDYIIAINNDENAPIFDIADCGIVGDIFEILEKYLNS